MSSLIKTRFILTQALAGKTINLGKLPYCFVDGKTELIANPEETKLHAKFLEVNWQAYPEGHEKLKELKDGQRNLQKDQELNQQHEVSGGVQPNGGGSASREQNPNARTRTTENPGRDAGTLPPWNGPQAELNSKLQRAVHSLDPDVDGHWTADGKPAITAVVAAYGANDVTRAAVEAVAPGFTRKAAQPSEE